MGVETGFFYHGFFMVPSLNVVFLCLLTSVQCFFSKCNPTLGRLLSMLFLKALII